ncbi:hypothetical protein GCM10010954_31320 [Halobacillus andaensis]|uniref:2-dehydro-3-deoxygalactonokinase n=1 Tax=Halobacillus andaensis TaxID=1176239 RepID=A0A917EY81_HALAA|nr:2-dehydro-3-deoxygalactonokinase [Halobacillus andaensis]MBP2005238.1 2-dehydro-3-deoxygalactonokinase [Halobacillus andaensis]GGF29932.1 hypothetical protein GCM10010954_31320 [Halobacillus andaensis]
MIIVIDSGTTNSRIRLVEQNSVDIIDALKLEVGVRNTAIDGHNGQLKQDLANGIKNILERNKLTKDDINYIVASGMITSNLGLFEVPHIESPAQFEKFTEAIQMVEAEEFLNIPCFYIPGMKNKVGDSLEKELSVINQYDVMRGEEVETYGLLNQLNPDGKGVMVLPGSHTKYVFIGENRELLNCRSTLGGEMLKAIRDQTIISDSLDEKLVEKIEPHYLFKGYDAARKVGATRSLYHVRLLQLFSELNDNERANYYAGAILSNDIQALEQMLEDEEVDWMIIGGSEPLRSLFCHLLSHVKESANMIAATDEQVELATVFGATAMAEAYYSTNKEGSST